MLFNTRGFYGLKINPHEISEERYRQRQLVMSCTISLFMSFYPWYQAKGNVSNEQNHFLFSIQLAKCTFVNTIQWIYIWFVILFSRHLTCTSNDIQIVHELIEDCLLAIPFYIKCYLQGWWQWCSMIEDYGITSLIPTISSQIMNMILHPKGFAYS